MANQSDGNTINWSHSSNSTHLPPKSPTLTSIPHDSTNNGSWGGFPTQGSAYNKQQHQRTTSASFAPHMQAPWLDHDMAEAPAKKSFHHRRAASDSVAFLEPTGQGSNCKAMSQHAEGVEFERLDDDQLMSMFGDMGSVQKQQNQRCANGNGVSSSGADACPSEKKTPGSTPETLSTPSDSNSGNEMSNEDARAGELNPPKSEPEVQSTNQSEGPVTNVVPKAQPSPFSSQLDPSMDPKRAKRILANRQSAQRSRVRKLQYIAELERSVNALQAEVSALTPQVAFLDHQRILLNVDNNTMKQRIASLMQDKRFKDVHNEALSKEVQRLRLVYQNQQEHLRSQQMQVSSGHSGFDGTHVDSDNFGVFVKMDSSNAGSNGALEDQSPNMISCLITPNSSHPSNQDAPLPSDFYD